MAKLPTRKLYDQNYYKAQAILRDPWFQEKATWLRKRFNESGCPIPKQPFKTYREYLAWNDLFWEQYTNIEHSQALKDAVNNITQGKTTLTAKEFYAVEDVREKMLPPLYGQVFRDMLDHFKIDRDDRGFHDFLELYFFFGKTEYPTSYLTVVWKRNEKTDEMELFVQILGHTKREDLERVWPMISEEQKHLKDFVGKSKAWTTFERDLEIYTLYKKLREESGRKRQEKWHATDQWIYSELHEKYPALTPVNIRNIISKTQKRLGESDETANGAA